MTEWRIVCVKKKMVESPEPHLHIANVGTGERLDWADMRWELDQVFQAMQEGDTFYVQSPLDGRTIPIEKCACLICSQPDIRTSGEDRVQDGLVYFRECIYQS